MRKCLARRGNGSEERGESKGLFWEMKNRNTSYPEGLVVRPSTNSEQHFNRVCANGTFSGFGSTILKDLCPC